MGRIWVALLVLFSVNYVRSYKILCTYPTPARSHFIVVDALLRGLAAKGHEITVINPFPPDQPIHNYRHIKHEIQESHVEMLKKVLKDPGGVNMGPSMIFGLIDMITTESARMLTNPAVQKLMNEETFDMVIVEFFGEPNIGLAAHFNCPAIVFSSVKAQSRMLQIMGNPLALSYAPNSIFQVSNLETFKSRLLNMLIYFADIGVNNFYFEGKYKEFHAKFFPAPKYPPFEEVIKNISAIFVASHFSQGDVRPLLPGVIEIGGLQMTEHPSPLPHDLQTWMDNSTNGVIYFSLGSNMRMDMVTPEKMEAFVKSFEKLELNVLWKSDLPEIPGLSKNVRLESWVSQNDVLQHKNLKLFITHGGYGSLMESKFYGIPVLVIPLFGDQITNAELVITEGWGTKLPYSELYTESLTSGINELLQNTRYSDRAKYESMLYRDRPLTALQNGIFWVEYIIRHKGARHLRSKATELNWFQLHSIDVIGFLIAVFVLWAAISLVILKYLFKKLFGAKKAKLKRN